MTLRLPAGSIFELRPKHRAEREFAQRVESAFRADDVALARVRASILAQASARSVTTTRPSRWTGSFSWRLAAVAAVLVVALASGFAIIRSVPAGSSQAVVPGGSATASQAANGASADLDQADTSLKLVLTAFRTSDAADLNFVLVAYQARLAAIAIDVRRPGTDVAAARARLVSQASSLAGIASSVTPANASLFKQVSADLAGVIASLPSKPTPAPVNPGASHKPTPMPTSTATPTPTKKPVSTATPGNGKSNGKGNGNGNGNAGGNGNGNAGGNGKGNRNGNASGNGNGNAGSNGKGTGKNH